ncbi:hypothetical protein [Phytoactinopolyspora halotolerans]|uniref:Uncharacterized protein n=1 Tax=Phytoactinopolyspora halotolerans TaxID=1981512 RepID=A0A6L9SHX9_9ACTN|nr:hypothetical protein [Phytoactinopolyspora halotolerans]NEE04727.1 hypothetical protein [Phytoactinopolyspora halotolerans]
MDLIIGQTGSAWRRSVLAAYRDGVITPARAVEFVDGVIRESELPNRTRRAQP